MGVLLLLALCPGIEQVTSTSRVADERSQHRAWPGAGRSRRAACVAREHRRAGPATQPGDGDPAANRIHGKDEVMFDSD